MVGYVFIYGVDGFGENVTIPEEGCYLNYQKALDRLVELNENRLYEFDLMGYEEGYYEDDYPASDLELAEAENNKDWRRFDELMSKHYRQLTLREYCEKYCVNNDPLYHAYAINKIEIYE